MAVTADDFYSKHYDYRLGFNYFNTDSLLERLDWCEDKFNHPPTSHQHPKVVSLWNWYSDDNKVIFCFKNKEDFFEFSIIWG